MKIERLSLKDSIEAMNSWISNSFSLPVVGKDYSCIRDDLNVLFAKASDKASGDIKSYELDVNFGALLFEYFKTKPWFTVRLASDDGFWRYLSLRVVPNIVGTRWGNNNADHYYTKPGRIWLKTLWWFYFLASDNTEVDNTRKMLLSKNFSTDTVLNLVERTGRGGTNVSVYRYIMKKYSSLEKVKEKDFRRIMKLNTAKAVVLEPAFCNGGEQGYVDSIFNELLLS